MTSAPEPFDAIADVYDNIFTNSAIGSMQRRSVWAGMDRAFQPGQRILELACGTGVDAVHMAERGIRVLACDSSPHMVAVARRRCDGSPCRDRVEFRTLAIEYVAELEPEGPFDGVLSNFSGLNCVKDLKRVANDLARLTRPGSQVIACLFGRTCLWEIFWYLAQCEPRKAFRRRQSSVWASLGSGNRVPIWYHSMRAFRADFSPNFRLRSRKGVGVAIPPSYLEALIARFPRFFRSADKVEKFLGHCPGLLGLGDHLVLRLERTAR